MGAVILEGVGKLLGVREIVHRDNIVVLTQLRDTHDGTTDTTEAIDSDLR